MSADIYHVVNSTHDPEVPVFILTCAVAGKVVSGEFSEVLLLETLGVFVNTTQHPGPRLTHDEEAAFVRFYFYTFFVDDFRLYAEERSCCRAGFSSDRSGHRGN